MILSHQESHDLREAYNENDFNHLACFLTAYFEDLISETNIWNSFIRLHKRLYDKPLPFFNTEAYFEEEINIQDISFLIWYFLNAIQEETFINPYNLFLTEFAALVIKIFDEEWEYAPENKVLKSFYQIDEKVDDYHIARIKIDNVLFKSYLFFPDTTLKLSNLELKILEKYRHNKDLNVFLFDSRDDLLNKIHTQLLSLTGKEWLAEIIGINHPLSAEFLKMSEKLKGNFLYKGQDDENIMVEHIASGRAFKVVKKSFSTYESLKKIDTIIYMGIIRWKEEWWFSGVQAQMLYDATLVLEEKNSLASKSAVNFLNNEPKKVKEVLEKQLKAFIAFNNGSPIAFMPSNKIEGFFKSYIEYYNKSLNFTVEEYEEHKNKMNKDEQRVIMEIASLDNVLFWHRNLETKKGFHINGYFRNHYPDFIIVTKRRNVILLETKGDHLDNDDSTYKNGLGKTWAEKCGSKYKYFMVFYNKEVVGTYTEKSIIEVIKSL